jgi:hypothetical protein
VDRLIKSLKETDDVAVTVDKHEDIRVLGLCRGQLR